MIHLWFIIICLIIINPTYAQQQHYDPTLCSSNTSFQGTTYICTSSKTLCKTYLVYRATQKYNTLLNISSLLTIPHYDTLLHLNNLNSSSQTLDLSREILIPITCSCSGKIFSANFTYVVPQGTTLPEIACRDFQGLVKSITLFEENSYQMSNRSFEIGLTLNLPLKCACPVNFSSGIGVKYLLTYPLIEGDSIKLLAMKFGIPVSDILLANNLGPDPTVYPNTTILVPLKNEPLLNFNVQDSEPPNPSFLPTLPFRKAGKKSLETKVYVVVAVTAACLVVIALITSGLYIQSLRKLRAKKRLKSVSFQTSCSTPRSSPFSGPATSNTSCLSPDLLVGLKYTLFNYTMDEIRRATNEFSKENKVCECVYKGFIDNTEVIIKQLRFEDTREIIDLHSRINHVNIVRLQGVCYGEDDSSTSSCLVFESPLGGCLRDSLAKKNNTASLQWHRRTQIAFDIATGLHYLHYCMIPQYSHRSLNSHNIFLTTKYRAKTTVFGGLREDSNVVDGWTTLEKADIFAFGIVLLELISGRADFKGNLLRESSGFLGGEEGGCFEQLRKFMDQSLKEDYPLAEALCLAVLARACVEDEPLHRPNMDDILKVLARMV